MAIRERKGRKKPWEVYWNNPFTLKRESLYVESEEEAKKQDALKKYQLKYEREIFRREESQEQKIEHTFESAYYLFLKDKRFSEMALKRHLKNMKPSLLLLKDTPLVEIDSAKLKIVLEHFRSRGIKASTIKRHMGQVFSLLQWAYQNDILQAAPKIPQLHHVEYEHFIPPTPHELAQIYAHASEHIRRVIVLGSQMGIRVGPSEMLKLEWSDIDLDGRVVHLRAARKNKKEPIRDIPIRQSLIEELRAWRKADERAGMKYVIHYQSRQITTIYIGWRLALKRAGIRRKIRPYDLRHAFATEAIAAGADVGTVARLMGHSNAIMILKHYQHVLDTQKIAAVEAIPEPEYVAKKCGKTKPENS